jgi:sulfur relay (sulfurtransferase) DsrF/TusC family protein
MTIIVQISRAPFGHENTFAGLYVASASLSKGLDVVVVLMGDGAFAARKGQVDPQALIFMPPTETQLVDIADIGGRIIVDRNALGERAIEERELIEGIEVMDTDEINDLILEKGEKIVAF